MTKKLQEDWQKEYASVASFQTALMRAIECADEVTLAKLEIEYPDIVQAYKRYSKK